MKRVVLSAVAVGLVYAAHAAVILFAALVVAYGEGDFECLGRLDERGYCQQDWGWWSPVMYLPEIALLTGGIIAASAKSFRYWMWTLAAAALAVAACAFALTVTDGWAVNQIPINIFWPLFGPTSW